MPAGVIQSPAEKAHQGSLQHEGQHELHVAINSLFVVGRFMAVDRAPDQSEELLADKSGQRTHERTNR
jgi:hypothetical protein